MATEVEIVAAANLIGLISAPLIAFAGLFFTHLGGRRNDERLRKRDEIDLERIRADNKVKEAANLREQERHDHDISLKLKEIKTERDGLLRNANQKISDERRIANQYLKDLYREVSDDFYKIDRALVMHQKAIQQSKNPADELAKIVVAMNSLENTLKDRGIVDEHGRITLDRGKFDGED